MAAEFAVTLPAVLLVVGLVAGLAVAQARQVLLQDVAADAARLASRGDDPGRAMGVADGAVSGISISTRRDGDFVCVKAAARASIFGVELPLTAAACALGEGRQE